MTISIQGGQIAISDAGKKGGDARVRSGRRMVWIRDPATVASFNLKFERLEEGGGSLVFAAIFPGRNRVFSGRGSDVTPASD